VYASPNLRESGSCADDYGHELASFSCGVCRIDGCGGSVGGIGKLDFGED
jgi:hypothetical protein